MKLLQPLGDRQRARDFRREVAGAPLVQRVPAGLPGLPGSMRGIPGVGQAPSPGACPVFPSSMKFISDVTASLAMGASETLVFSTPGAFCPMKMFVIGSVDTTDVFVTGIKSGLEEQIISGNVPGDLWALENDCCPVACLSCICSPGVTYEVTVLNNDAMAQTVTVVLVGSYRDACPPGMNPDQMLPDVPGCPRPGGDKLLAFNNTLAMGGSDSEVLTTPGKFCPRQLFVGLGGQPGDVSITGIKSGLKDQIISGSLPATLFSTSNECCVLACFDCLCAPGYPLTLDLLNNDAMNASTINGVLVGSYTDACP